MNRNFRDEKNKPSTKRAQTYIPREIPILEPEIDHCPTCDGPHDDELHLEIAGMMTRAARTRFEEEGGEDL